MELSLTVLKNYRVDVVRLTPYRDRYTVVELDEGGNTTGRSWWEPYNSVSGDPDELVARFNKRIAGDNAPTPEDYTELTLFANALANECVKANRPLVVSVVTSSLNKAVEQAIERCELLANQKEAAPKQVIVEGNVDRLVDGVLTLLRRAVRGAVREAVEQARHPYETLRGLSAPIEQAIGELNECIVALRGEVEPTNALFSACRRFVGEHYKLTRWQRFKSVFARDKNATSSD